MQKQEVAFTAWLNQVLMPVHATATAREAAGMSTATEVGNPYGAYEAFMNLERLISARHQAIILILQVATSLALWRVFSKDEAFITAMTAVERRIKNGHLSLEVSRMAPGS